MQLFETDTVSTFSFQRNCFREVFNRLWNDFVKWFN